MHQYYHVCCSHIGRAVTIRTLDGRVYNGKITRVTREEVHLSSVGRGVKGEQQNIKDVAKQADTSNELPKGEEIIFFFPFVIPLAAIAGITLIGTAPFWGRGFVGYGGFRGPRRFY